MNSVNLDFISNIGGIFNVDSVIRNAFKDFETKLEYINTCFSVSHLSAQILEELGLFLSEIKDIKASLKLPEILSMPRNISVLIQIANNFFESIKCNDTESVLNNGFNFFANSIDFLGDINALSNSFEQLLKLPDVLISPEVTTVLYPLSLIAIIIGTLIKIRDYMQVKLMMTSDVAIISHDKISDYELKKFITPFLEKRLTVTKSEALLIDKEEDSVKRVKMHDDLMKQKKAKYNRLVGPYAQEQLVKLNDCVNGRKRYSSIEVRGIATKIGKIYEHENSAKVKTIVRNIFVIISTLFLTQGALLIPGCLLLIVVTLSSIRDFIKAKNFYNELKSS